MIVDTRVYISNVSYACSEEELKDYLKDFNVNSVLIPSQTVRKFRRTQTRSFGIAYADFLTAEDAKRVIEECNGKEFKGRVLRVKQFNPYTPPKPIRERVESTLLQLRKFTGYDEYMRAGTENTQITGPIETSIQTDAITLVDAEAEGEGGAEAEQDIVIPSDNAAAAAAAAASTTEQIRDKELSLDTLYCAFLPKETTDPELREYLVDYLPREIWIFKTKSIHSGPFKLRSTNHTAALVTLAAGIPLEEVINSLQGKKFLNKKITLKPAYLSKIEEVRKVADKSKIISVGDADTVQPEVESEHSSQFGEAQTHNEVDIIVPKNPKPVDPTFDMPVSIQPVNDKAKNKPASPKSPFNSQSPTQEPLKSKNNKKKKKKKQNPETQKNVSINKKK
ncbi:Regulator of rDNA transcription protein 5 [Nakaseomyces bracarensis]|uniref:Regulator of rDNA transcription protein 5 n=1 Tax=Nakaseomyces bracarensis TaxID=273131 RepID=A0ABR4P0K8_9SACH